MSNLTSQQQAPNFAEKTAKPQNESKKLKTNEQISDLSLITNLNKYVFYVFLFFFFALNLTCFIILPYFVMKPLSL